LVCLLFHVEYPTIVAKYQSPLVAVSFKNQLEQPNLCRNLTTNDSS
jgi:hypothetical protein